jgi:hypothetical protein
METVEFRTIVHNGIIEIPVEYRKDYFADIRVILFKNKSRQDIKDSSIQERVAVAERLIGIASREPITLEEINNLALKDEVCCFGKESVSGYIPFISALKGRVCTPRRQSKTKDWRGNESAA